MQAVASSSRAVDEIHEWLPSAAHRDERRLVVVVVSSPALSSRAQKQTQIPRPSPSGTQPSCLTGEKSQVGQAIIAASKNISRSPSLDPPPPPLSVPINMSSSSYKYISPTGMFGWCWCWRVAVPITWWVVESRDETSKQDKQSNNQTIRETSIDFRKQADKIVQKLTEERDRRGAWRRERGQPKDSKQQWEDRRDSEGGRRNSRFSN